MEEEIRLCHYLSDPSDQIFLQLRLLFLEFYFQLNLGMRKLTRQWAVLLWASSWQPPSSPRALMEAPLWILANQWRYIRLPPEWRWTTNTSAAVVNGRLKQREERRNENNKSLGSITSLIRYARNLHYWENTFTIWGCTTGFILRFRT